jgi:hypothetical protein
MIEALPIPAPLLDLVEVAPVGVVRIVGVLVGPAIHRRRPQSSSALRFTDGAAVFLILSQ